MVNNFMNVDGDNGRNHTDKEGNDENQNNSNISSKRQKSKTAGKITKAKPAKQGFRSENALRLFCTSVSSDSNVRTFLFAVLSGLLIHVYFLPSRPLNVYNQEVGAQKYFNSSEAAYYAKVRSNPESVVAAGQKV